MILSVYTNQAQSESMSYLISGLIIAALVFGLSSGRLFFNDKFDIGYIEEKPTPVISNVVIKEKPEVDELQELKKKVQIAKLKRELAELEKPVFNNDLFNDCVDILAGLGVPKRKAKAEAQVIFEKYPDIKDHNEFIERYGKR